MFRTLGLQHSYLFEFHLPSSSVHNNSFIRKQHKYLKHILNTSQRHLKQIEYPSKKYLLQRCLLDNYAAWDSFHRTLPTVQTSRRLIVVHKTFFLFWLFPLICPGIYFDVLDRKSRLSEIKQVSTWAVGR